MKEKEKKKSKGKTEEVKVEEEIKDPTESFLTFNNNEFNATKFKIEIE